MNQNLHVFLLLCFVFFQKNKIQAQDVLASPTYYLENFNTGSTGWSFKQSNTNFKWKSTIQGPRKTFLDGKPIPPGVIDPPLKKVALGDRWMILDAFEGGKPAPSGIDATLISPRYDCSEFNEVYLRFNTMFRRYDSQEQLWIGTSTDSINFQYEEVFKNIKIEQFSDEKFTYLKTLPFVSIQKLNNNLAKKSKVWIAFRYKAPAFEEGNYSWQIDDVELFDKNPTPNCDFKIFDDACAIPPFRVIPASQLDSIPFLMDVKNNSLLAKKDVEIQVSVEDVQAKSIVFQDKKTIANMDIDETLKNISFNKKFLPNPAVKTTYKIVYKVKGTCGDEVENNNTYAYYFDVVEDVFQKEKGTTRRVSPDGLAFNKTNWSCGNHFFIKNAKDLEVKEIVCMIDNVGKLKGDSIIAKLFKWENSNNDDQAQLEELQLVASSVKYCDGLSNDNFIYNFPVLNTQKQKAILEDDSDYLAVIEYKNMTPKEDITMQMLVSDTLFYDACFSASTLNGKLFYNSVVRIGSEPNFDTNGFETPMTPVIRLVFNKKSVGSDDLKFEVNSTIYPNPVQDEFQIKTDQQSDIFTYEIYNSLGQIMMKNKSTSDEKINVSGLLPGVYFVKINDRMMKIVKK